MHPDLPAPRPSTVIETHLSRVHLFEDEVLKTLKPIHFAFADFSTRERREEACAQEVRHNSPWAPGIYLGVSTLDGEPAVHMRRLPEEATLVARVGALTCERIEQLGRFLRSRHEAMPARPASTQPDAVWGRIDTNLDELEDVLGGRSAHLVAQIRACRARLAPECQWLLAMREGEGCLLHGDLRAEHVYDLGSYFVVLDGVAFAEELAVGDPLEDVAFLAMDLGCSLGRWDLVDALWNGWGVTHRTGLCDLYAGHRSLIRAKVACLQHDDEAVARHLVNALVHWETPGRRPVLIGVGGLPGVGKSTVARAAQQALNLTVIRTDVVRKELGPADYSEAGRTAVYDAVLSEARKRLLVGERVVVDASLGKESWRHRVLELGQTMGVPVVLLFVQAPETVATARLAERSGDASDADVRVYHLARDAWEQLSPETSRVTVSVQNGGSVETAVSATADALLCRGLCLEA